jgi:alanine-synthesizing transaminase
LRNTLLYEGASQLEYEIRQIARKAEQVAQHGVNIVWENIGDPIQKHNTLPDWMKAEVSELVLQDSSYGYCHSKGIPETRKFLAARTNALGGVQISADDILFFNGLGDAISKLYQYLPSTSRIIGPSPAYSTHSSAEAAHANSSPITYDLDPENNWYPNLEELENKIKYNANIAGILIINPDNPTGMIYPPDYLEKIVRLATDYDLLLIADEIYSAITLNKEHTLPLAEIIGKRPAISMKGISKELPWPGARCGWMEFYNRKEDDQFNRFCLALEDAKMVEVCSTTLPQKAIPKIMGHPKYPQYVMHRNAAISDRGRKMDSLLSDVPYIRYIDTKGAFYNTILFRPEALRPGQHLVTHDSSLLYLLREWITPDLAPDRRFAYYLLATRGICVVPLSSFQSNQMGIRVTLLEENPVVFESTFRTIREAVIEYCTSV